MPLEECRDMPIAEAKAMGAMALFGEKYGDRVRVVKFGESVELCGGTHVANTGNIGMVRIVSESSIAAGIRRIEAVSGAGVEKVLDTLQDTMRDLSTLIGGNGDIRQAVKRSIDENAELKHQVEEFMEERTRNITAKIMESSKNFGGVTVCRAVGIMLPEMVKNVAFNIRKQAEGPTVFVGATEAGGKPLLTLMISDDLTKQGLNAGQIVREAAKLIKGGGGGQPFFAQAGGKDAEGLSAAADKIFELLNLEM